MSPESYRTPHSDEAEQSVLGALLIDNNAIDRMGNLTEQQFFTEAHRLIFKAIRMQAALGKAWDAVTIAGLLEKHGKLNVVGGMAYLGELAMAVPSSANIGCYSEIVADRAMRRSIMEAAAELTEMAVSGADVAVAMDRAQSRLLAITEGVKTNEPRSISQILSEHMDVIDRRMSAEKKGITTGLDELDSMLNGGWHRGQVIVLAARPSMGKTALSLHNAIEAARAGFGALYLSMEMVASELADRAVAAYGRVQLSSLLTGDMKSEEWSGVTAAVGRLHELPLHVVDRPGLTYFQVATYARRHKRKHGLDVLVLDYLQLMAGDSSDKRHAQIEEITRGLKVLAKELNVAVLLLSQLSRKTEDARRPKLSHLRDSGSIEQDADVVLFIHREEVDNPDTAHKGYADVYIAKNRQGRLGRIGVTYIGAQVRFEPFDGDLPDWNAQPATPARRTGLK